MGLYLGIILSCILVVIGCKHTKDSESSLLQSVGPKVVSVFDGTHVFHGKESRRTVGVDLKLPDVNSRYDTAYMKLKLSCPLNENGVKDCDFWDRKGQIFLTTLENGQETRYEIMRFMTPYGVGGTWEFDVSDLLPLLRGQVKFEVFIDTWVGPGHAQGEGWLVDLDIGYSFIGRSKVAVAVMNVFEPRSVSYGEPGDNSKQVQVLQNFPPHSSVKLWSYLTGHGQNVGAGPNNCAEFCDKVQSFKVNDLVQQKRIWRYDCAKTVTDGVQRGNWTVGRAGWCPGDMVHPIKISLNEQLSSGNTISWSPEFWVNPHNGGYDGNRHTQPYFEVSSLLIFYK